MITTTRNKTGSSAAHQSTADFRIIHRIAHLPSSYASMYNSLSPEDLSLLCRNNTSIKSRPRFYTWPVTCMQACQVPNRIAVEDEPDQKANVLFGTVLLALRLPDSSRLLTGDFWQVPHCCTYQAAVLRQVLVLHCICLIQALWSLTLPCCTIYALNVECKRHFMHSHRLVHHDTLSSGLWDAFLEWQPTQYTGTTTVSTGAYMCDLAMDCAAMHQTI